MIVLYGEASSRSKDDRLRGGIIAAVKAVARRSILMQITKIKAVNGFH
jgi:hypothetical protein